MAHFVYLSSHQIFSERGLKFKQVFTNNMSDKTEPSISSTDKTEDFTRITFKPDLPRFGMDVLDADIVALLTRRVYDIAGLSAVRIQIAH